MPDAAALLAPIRALHERIRVAVVESCATRAADSLSAVASDGPGDTIYAIDRVSEEVLVDGLREIAAAEPLLLLAEGLPPAGVPLPRGTREGDCRWRVLVDPIDGTRGLMYQKRSAWILTGVAPNRGEATNLRDIVLAVQTEIPILKQHLQDQLWAFRGRGVEAHRVNRLSGEVMALRPRPTGADSIAHGYASFVRFFPGAGEVLGAVDDKFAREVLGPPVAGKAASFEDQYASTGGQLYELMMGHDRFIADLRALVAAATASHGRSAGLCCHPYDLSTALIAEEAGVVLTGARGEPLEGPLDLRSNLSWIGYANARLQRRLEPVLQRVLRRHGLLAAAQA